MERQKYALLQNAVSFSKGRLAMKWLYFVVMTVVVLGTITACAGQSGGPSIPARIPGGGFALSAPRDSNSPTRAALSPEATFTPTALRNPRGRLLLVKGVLYGALENAGQYNDGAVFSYDPASGVESTFFSLFNYGEHPNALVATDGNIYGTTYRTRRTSAGEIFGISQSDGKLQTAYAFSTASGSPAYPAEGLLYRQEQSGGTFFGTSYGGGTASCFCGTIYSDQLSADGTSHKVVTLYSFQDGPDGQGPRSRLINPAGSILYGTASQGGTFGGRCGHFGCGTVFAFDTSTKKETTLYQFQSENDAGYPEGELFDLNGNLYGLAGGGSSQGGALFRVNATTGAEQVVHDFGSYNGDGIGPNDGSLIYVDGLFYGVTSAGGNGESRGTVFSFNPDSGEEKIVCSFGNKPDASSPVGGLTEYNGELYGITQFGGANGDGAIFEVSTSGNERVVYSF